MYFNPKKAGSFYPISQPGGGATPPPSDLGGFQIMQIYVNIMHMFIFLIIFNKIRGF